MTSMNRFAALCLLLAPACASSSGPFGRGQEFDEWPRPEAPSPRRPLVTGMLGLSELEVTDMELDPALGSIDDTDDTSLPMIGAAVQMPLAGRRLRIGLEGGSTLGWDGDVEAIVIGSGGAIIAAENDFLLLDLFGGVFADLPLGERLRVYAGVGPLLQFGAVDAEWDDPVLGDVSVHEDAFGKGYYARAGFEIALDYGTSVGLGLRFVDSEIDPSGDLDDVEFQEYQYVLTATQGL